jgi:hypothetical protein
VTGNTTDESIALGWTHTTALVWCSRLGLRLYFCEAGINLVDPRRGKPVFVKPPLGSA